MASTAAVVAEEDIVGGIDLNSAQEKEEDEQDGFDEVDRVDVGGSGEELGGFRVRVSAEMKVDEVSGTGGGGFGNFDGDVADSRSGDGENDGIPTGSAVRVDEETANSGGLAKLFDGGGTSVEDRPSDEIDGDESGNAVKTDEEMIGTDRGGFNLEDSLVEESREGIESQIEENVTGESKSVVHELGFVTVDPVDMDMNISDSVPVDGTGELAEASPVIESLVKIESQVDYKPGLVHATGDSVSREVGQSDSVTVGTVEVPDQADAREPAKVNLTKIVVNEESSQKEEKLVENNFMKELEHVSLFAADKCEATFISETSRHIESQSVEECAQKLESCTDETKDEKKCFTDSDLLKSDVDSTDKAFVQNNSAPADEVLDGADVELEETSPAEKCTGKKEHLVEDQTVDRRNPMGLIHRDFDVDVEESGECCLAAQTNEADGCKMLQTDSMIVGNNVESTENVETVIVETVEAGGTAPTSSESIDKMQKDRAEIKSQVGLAKHVLSMVEEIEAEPVNDETDKVEVDSVVEFKNVAEVVVEDASCAEKEHASIYSKAVSIGDASNCAEATKNISLDVINSGESARTPGAAVVEGNNVDMLPRIEVSYQTETTEERMPSTEVSQLVKNDTSVQYLAESGNSGLANGEEAPVGFAENADGNRLTEPSTSHLQKDQNRRSEATSYYLVDGQSEVGGYTTSANIGFKGYQEVASEKDTDTIPVPMKDGILEIRPDEEILKVDVVLSSHTTETGSITEANNIFIEKDAELAGQEIEFKSITEDQLNYDRLEVSNLHASELEAVSDVQFVEAYNNDTLGSRSPTMADMELSEKVVDAVQKTGEKGNDESNIPCETEAHDVPGLDANKALEGRFPRLIDDPHTDRSDAKLCQLRSAEEAKPLDSCSDEGSLQESIIEGSNALSKSNILVTSEDPNVQRIASQSNELSALTHEEQARLPKNGLLPLNMCLEASKEINEESIVGETKPNKLVQVQVSFEEPGRLNGSDKLEEQDLQIAKDASVSSGAVVEENKPQSTGCLYQQAVDGFLVSDLVWGKVKSHPWWPGQVFDASDASDLALKYQKKDAFLIAYFGDKTFAWCDESQLKPFETYFPQMEKQSSSDLFVNALNGGLEEVSRRTELGLCCSCLPEEATSSISCQRFDNAGVRKGHPGYVVGNSIAAECLEPGKILQFLKDLACFPAGETNRLELVKITAQIKAFYKSKGYFSLPSFYIGGGLIEEDVGVLKKDDIQHLTPNSSVSKVGKHKSRVRPSLSSKKKNDTEDGEKDKSVSELMEIENVSHLANKRKNKIDSRLGGKSFSPSSGKRHKNTDSDSSDSGISKKKRLETLVGEKKTDFKDGEKDKGIFELTKIENVSKVANKSKTKIDSKLGSKSFLVSSAKRHKTIDSDSSDSGISKKKRLETVVGKETKLPSPTFSSFKVGECIRRVASQLTKTPPILKSHCENSQKNVTKDDDVFDVFTAETPNSVDPESKSMTEIKEDMILEDLLLELHLTACDPIEACSSAFEIIPFLSEFRNFAVSTAAEAKSKAGRKRGRKKKVDDVQPSSSDMLAIDHMQDAYWSDMIFRKKSSNVTRNKGEAKTQSQKKKRKPPGQMPSALVLVPELQGGDQSPIGLTSPSRKPLPRMDRHIIRVEEKMVNEYTPTALILNFNRTKPLPSETDLIRIFSRYGPLKEAATEVQKKKSRVKVVFKRRADAEVAFSSAGKYSTFGPSLLSYQLKHLTSTHDAPLDRKPQDENDDMLVDTNSSDIPAKADDGILPGTGQIDVATQESSHNIGSLDGKNAMLVDDGCFLVPEQTHEGAVPDNEKQETFSQESVENVQKFDVRTGDVVVNASDFLFPAQTYEGGALNAKKSEAVAQEMAESVQKLVEQNDDRLVDRSNSHVPAQENEGILLSTGMTEAVTQESVERVHKVDEQNHDILVGTDIIPVTQVSFESIQNSDSNSSIPEKQKPLECIQKLDEQNNKVLVGTGVSIAFERSELVGSVQKLDEQIHDDFVGVSVSVIPEKHESVEILQNLDEQPGIVSDDLVERAKELDRLNDSMVSDSTNSHSPAQTGEGGAPDAKQIERVTKELVENAQKLDEQNG